MQTLSNSQADAEWFLMKIREGFTVRELADLPCVWMTGEEIANLVGIEYTPPAYISKAQMQAREDAARIILLRRTCTQAETRRLTGFSITKIRRAEAVARFQRRKA